MQLNSNVPSGPLETKWERYKFDLKRVNPANKRKFEVIVVEQALQVVLQRQLWPILGIR